MGWSSGMVMVKLARLAIDLKLIQSASAWPKIRTNLSGVAQNDPCGLSAVPDLGGRSRGS